MNRAVVTSADANHFDLVEGLLSTLASVSGFEADVFLLDGGLDDDQRDSLKRQGVEVVDVARYISIETEDGWLRTLAAQPFIPEYIPGYAAYLWIDADAWVQDPAALYDLEAACLQQGFAASSFVHHGYRQIVAPSPRMPGVPTAIYCGWLYDELLDNIGASLMRAEAYLSAGVWSASSSSGMFRRWQAAARQCYRQAQDRSPESSASRNYGARLTSDPLWPGGKNLTLFHANEVSMNLAARCGPTDPAILSARHNWHCSMSIPMMDRDGQFVDTAWPHDPILIVHQSGQTKSGTWPVKLVEGGRKNASLRAPVIR